MLKIEPNKRVFFTSDLHFNHDKDFLYEPRGFKNVNDMNKQILENFKTTLNWDDILFVLGDNWLGDLDAGFRLFNQIPGKKYLIKGNHDTDARWEYLGNKAGNFVLLGEAATVRVKGFTFYLSHYPTVTTNFNDYEKPLHRRLLNISGHTHSPEKWQKEVPTSYNVCLEAHNLMPVEATTVIEDFKEKYLKE